MVPAARLRLFYFLYYGNVGAFLPYFSPYLRGLGFSGEQIGTVQMLPSLLAPAVAIAWATWADRRGTLGRALRRATAWAAACALALPLARTPLAVGAVVLLQSLGDRAVVPLVDSTTLEWCRADPAHAYARIRLFGSLGFIALSVALGHLLTLRGDRAGDVLVPLAVAACVAGYAAVARAVPSPPAHPGPRPGLGDMAKLLRDRRLVALTAACGIHWAGCAPFHLLFGVFVRDRRLLALTAACGIHWAGCAPFHLLFGVFVHDRGLPADVTGYGMAVGVAAEVAVLLAFPRLERRFSLRALFAAAFLATAVRWGLLSRAGSAEAIVALQLLHGFTFGLFWGSAMKALAEDVPPQLRATGQALFSAVALGGGNAVGYFLSGVGYDRLGGVAPLFAWAAVLEIAPLGLAWATVKKRVL